MSCGSPFKVLLLLCIFSLTDVGGGWISRGNVTQEESDGTRKEGEREVGKVRRREGGKDRGREGGKDRGRKEWEEGGREALNDINSTVCNFQSIFMRPAEKSFELTLVNQIIGNKVGEIAQ